jgi:transposase
MDASAKNDGHASGRRATRRMRTIQEKLAIVQEALQPGNSIAAVARKHEVNHNLLFGWMRLHRRGLLTEQRQAKPAPLLSVKISTPTLTPTEPAGDSLHNQQTHHVTASAAVSHESMLELVLPEGTCVRLYGDAQRVVLERILKQLSLR